MQNCLIMMSIIIVYYSLISTSLLLLHVKEPKAIECNRWSRILNISFYDI